MLKVFLVEDEIIVREGIKNSIDWEQNGLIFCGEASDGELALPVILEEKPDIVITDIRMPFMDGLELARQVKKELPWIKIVILSGYGEFEYAKEAINIGITQYLLKPISKHELTKCLITIRDNILAEQNEHAVYEKYKFDLNEYYAEDKRRLFYDMVSGACAIDEIIERGKKLNLELNANAYNIILYKVKEAKVDLHDSRIPDNLSKELEALIEQHVNAISFDCLLEGNAILLKGDSTDNVIKLQKAIVAGMEQLFAGYKDISYFGGIGKTVMDISELSASFQEASRVFAYRYILDESHIFDSKEIAYGQADLQNNGADLEGIMQLNKKKAEEFLRSGNKKDIHYFVEEYLKCISNDSRSSLLFRQYIVVDMYCIVAAFAQELGCSRDSIAEPFNEYPQLNMLFSFEQISKYIEDIFSHVIDLRDNISSSKFNDIINKAKNYINDNYTDDELSLNQVANHVYLSPTYFSAIFSQKTGQTFIQYLTDLRMSKAKELLKCTDMKTAEIAYAVGYKDPHYFSYIFKKTQNSTPKQYRFS